MIDWLGQCVIPAQKSGMISAKRVKGGLVQRKAAMLYVDLALSTRSLPAGEPGWRTCLKRLVQGTVLATRVRKEVWN